MRDVELRPDSNGPKVSADTKPDSAVVSERLRLLVRNRFDRAARGGYAEPGGRFSPSKFFFP